MNAIFINKKTNKIVDIVPYYIDGGCSPMQEFYVVLSTTERKIGDTVDVSPLRVKYPDKKTQGIGDDGKPYESIEYGKYSEHGMCIEPWEVLNG